MLHQYSSTNCVTRCKNESKSDIAASLFCKKLERFQRSIVCLLFQELRRFKFLKLRNQNKIICESKCVFQTH